MFESLAGDEDYEEFKFIMGRLRWIIPSLIKKLTQIGAKKAVELVCKYGKKLYNAQKKSAAIRYILYGLVFIAITTGIYTVKTYNEKPVIPDTKVEYSDEDKSMVVYEEDKATAKFVMDENEEPTIVRPDDNKIPDTRNVNNTTTDNNTEAILDDTDEKKKSQLSTKVKYTSPIVLLDDNMKKSDSYKMSDEMVEALMKVEDFVDHIYDAKNPKRTNINMNDMRQDLTIGYGHKLTKAERKAWSKNKKMSREEAERIFREDLKETEKYLNKKLAQLPYDSKVEYSQGFVDGMGSLLFNMGYGNMFGAGRREESEFWSRLNKCRIDKNNNCMNVSDINFSIGAVRNQNITERGHIARRKAEYRIMMQPLGVMNPELYDLKKL